MKPLRNAVAALLFLVPQPALAADAPVALFLREAEPGAHLYSMGRIFTTLDFKDTFSRPWTSGDNASAGITFSHWPGVFDGASFDFAAAAFATRQGTFSFSGLRYSAGDELIDEFDGSQRTVRLEEDTLVSLGYGLAMGRQLYAGAALKYLSSTLAGDYSAGGLLADAGFLYHFKGGVHHAGLAVRNIGQPVTYYRTAEPLPSGIEAGYTADVYYGEQRVVAGLSFEQLLDAPRQSMGAGFAFYPADVSYLSLHGGIRSLDTDLYYTLGLGIIYGGFSCDIGYRFTGAALAENTDALRFAVTWLWGVRAAERPADQMGLLP